MDELQANTIAAIGGLAGGIVLGFAARWGKFCTLAAMEDAFFSSSLDRVRMWVLAIAVAIAGTHLLAAFGFFELEASYYLSEPVSLFSTLAGSVMFGIGMAFVGTCGYGMLARVGGGDLKSIVTFLVMGISAYAMMNGLTALLRVKIFDVPTARETPASIAYWLSSATGLPLLAIALTIAAAIAAWALLPASLRREPRKWITAVAVGLAIVWGWFATGWLADDGFGEVVQRSYTFTGPLGDTIMYAMTASGAKLNFGVGAVAGVVVGAVVAALFMREFRWEACDDVVELRRQMFGGFLMGTGGVLALGCTVGQGLSAASMLAWSAPLALAGMFTGAWIGLHYLMTGNPLEPFRALYESLQRQGETG